MKATPPNSASSAFRSNATSPRDSASAMPKIGVMSGETSIAPITTAALSASSPNAAMPADTVSST